MTTTVIIKYQLQKYLYDLVQCRRELMPFSSGQWVTGREHPGQVVSPLQTLLFAFLFHLDSLSLLSTVCLRLLNAAPNYITGRIIVYWFS